MRVEIAELIWRQTQRKSPEMDMLSVSDIAGIPFVRLFPGDFAEKNSVFAIVWPRL
jgi:hypothetical protein